MAHIKKNCKGCKKKFKCYEKDGKSKHMKTFCRHLGFCCEKCIDKKSDEEISMLCLYNFFKSNGFI